MSTHKYKVIAKTTILSKPRPDTYWDEVVGISIDRDSWQGQREHVILDIESPEYEELLARYLDYQPTDEDITRARGPRMRYLQARKEAKRPCEINGLLIPYKVSVRAALKARRSA